MEQPLITVVVPIYNVEQYLERCLNSIVNQTYKNLEIILVDDGSPDRCPEMCDEWASRDSRIRVIHKQNAGLGMARNSGIEAATGSYICFFDSDDYVDLETVELAYQMTEEHRADLVVFGMNSVDRDGNITACLAPESPKSCYRGQEIRELFLQDWIDCRHKDVQIKNLCLSACSCLFSAELIHRIRWRFVSERELISEDSYALIQLAEHLSSVAVLEKALYYYCDNQSSLSHTYRVDRFERIKQFYDACLYMVQALGFPKGVQNAVAGVTFSFVIAAMKQIAKSDLSKKQKWNLLSQIIADDTMKDILHTIHGRYNDTARKLFIFCMRKRLTLLTGIMLALQVRRRHK